MKKTLILFTVAAVLFGSACNDDSDDYRLSLITGPAINALPYKQITLSDNENDFISLSWSQAKFFINGAAQSSPSAPVQYSLLIKQADSDTAGVVFSSTANLHSEISADKLNSFVINNFGVEPGDTVNLSFLVSASYGEGSPKNVLSQNSVDLSVITFVSQKPTLENIYICGDMNSWNNSGTEFLMFKTNNDMSDYNYTYTGYFAQGAAFKFISASALGSWDNLYYSAGDGNMILGNSADDSFSVTDAGYYTI